MLEPIAPGLGRAIRRRIARAIGFQREEPLLLDRQYQLWLAQKRRALDRQDVQKRVDTLQYRPLISLLVPVFDPDRMWLVSALSSAQSQFYPRWELCAVDDGSRRPHVRRLLHRFAACDARIHVAVSERNEGICAASNRALRMAPFAPSTLTFRTRPGRTYAAASPRRVCPARSSSRIARRACS